MEGRDSQDDVDRDGAGLAEPDLDDLARRYLDLWQQYLTQCAQDPALSAALARMSGGTAAWPAALLGTAPGQGAFDTAPGQGAARGEPAAGPDGTAAAGNPPDGGGDDLGELARRVAALEERLAALERKPRGARKSPAGKPRSRRS